MLLLCCLTRTQIVPKSTTNRQAKRVVHWWTEVVRIHLATYTGSSTRERHQETGTSLKIKWSRATKIILELAPVKSSFSNSLVGLSRLQTITRRRGKSLILIWCKMVLKWITKSTNKKDLGSRCDCLRSRLATRWTRNTMLTLTVPCWITTIYPYWVRPRIITAPTARPPINKNRSQNQPHATATLKRNSVGQIKAKITETIHKQMI